MYVRDNIFLFLLIKLVSTYYVLNNRYYDHIFSQFNITVISHYIMQYITDLTSMYLISFCTATLVCVDKLYTVSCE